MLEVFRFALLGLGTGAVIASVALGLTLTHRASGVVNFGQGAMASWAAYTYFSLTEDGSIPLLPMPFVPASIDLGAPKSPVEALVGALVVAIGLSLAVYWLVFRPLRHASALAKIAASVGIMIALQAALVVQFGFRQRPIEPLVPDDPVSYFGITLGADRYILLGLVVVLTGAVSLLYARTRFGIATRAAAEDERSAVLLGVSPSWVASINWVLASVISATVGILASAITGLTPSALTLVVVPALAAALVANFRSFWIATLTGILMGMAQGVILLAEVRVEWWPKIGLGTALPFAVIAAVMLLSGRSLPTRGAVEQGSLPDAYSPTIDKWRRYWYGALVLLLLIAVVILPFEYRASLNFTMVGILLALSLVVVTGYVGQISLLQMCLAGIGAFAVTTVGLGLGWPFIPTAVAAAVSATLFGVLVGLPSLRTRGASLAILTLSAGVALETLVLTRNNWFGADGPVEAPVPTFLGISLGTGSPFPWGNGTIPSPAFGLLLAVVTCVACFGVMRLRRTRLGSHMLAVRSNERAAAAAGVNVAVVKLVGFGIGAGLAGIGGAMTAYNLGSFTAAPFSVTASLILLAVAYLGGISTVGGAIWAGAISAGGVIFVIQSEFYDAGQYTAYIAGLGLILTAVLYPEGIDGAMRALMTGIHARLRRRLNSLANSAVTETPASASGGSV